MNKASKIIAGLFLLFSFLGFLDASYLTAKHYLGEPVTCAALGGGCEKVTTSEYSTIFGVSVALPGALYYLSVFILSLWYFDRGQEKTLKFLSWYVFVGLAASIYFVFLQAFVIKTWCLYCLGSAVTSTALFIVGLVYMRLSRRQPGPISAAGTLS